MMMVQETLNLYRRTWLDDRFYDDPSIEQQRRCLARFHHLLDNSRQPLARSNRPGHLTGSAFVVDSRFELLLLTLHGKLNLWLQLGGHADGNADIAAVALQEAYEESGLTSLSFLDTRPLFPRLTTTERRLAFDIDVHQIPAFADDSAHFHYDISYILVAEHTTPLKISDESHDLRWFTWQEAEQKCDDNIKRCLGKLSVVRQHLVDRNDLTPPPKY